jgi:hypothetical protein
MFRQMPNVPSAQKVEANIINYKIEFPSIFQKFSNISQKFLDISLINSEHENADFSS